MREENRNTSDSTFIFDIVLNKYRRGVSEPLAGENPPQEPTKKYTLRIKGKTPEKNVRKQLLRKILTPCNPAEDTQNKYGSTKH